MSCLNCFESTLCYTAPSHGDWGIVRIAALVPETHLLFVSPSACGRHGALGALQHGFKDRVSYLAITREDIIAGYDGLVEEAVSELLRRKNPRPRAVLIFVSCLDDLIGTDLNSLCQRLHAAHPDVEFQPAHMNPITLDSKKPPMVTTQAAMYAFLHPAEAHDQGINLIGNLDALHPGCELFQVLKAWDCAPVRHLSDFETFEGYQAMAKSRANLMLSPIASLAAQQMQARLGIPQLFLPVSYDPDEVRAEYEQLAAFLEKDAPNLPRQREEALCETETARSALNGRPVWITAGSVLKPFGLARALVQAGFNVEAVVAQTAIAPDRAAFQWIRENHPEIAVIQPQHVNVIDFAHRSEEAVAIGFDAAYIAGASRVVSIVNDAGMFGYHGIARLMRSLREEAAHPQDLKKLIDDYGVVI